MAKAPVPAPADEPLVCTPKRLPGHLQEAAATCAVANNPANAPPHGVAAALAALSTTSEPTLAPTPDHLAVLVARYWGSGGVKLNVGFMEETPDDLAARILAHMNAWSEFCNAQFTLVSYPDTAQVRITLAGDGYWSYLGTDILSIPPDQPTMCLQGFSMDTPESEYHRVVRHETGHTLGFPHEHARRQIVALLDRRKTISYFKRTQGWDQQTILAQILTPLEERSIYGTPKADTQSIMTYSFPGSCTKSGKAILGGTDIDPLDQAFCARLYPQPGSAPPPLVMPAAE